MDDRGRERWQANGDVPRPLRARRRVLPPLSGVCDDRLSGIDVEGAAPRGDAERAMQHDRVFLELGALPPLDPPAGADHTGYAHGRGAAVDPPDVLLDALGPVACRFNDFRLCDMRRHASIIIAVTTVGPAATAPGWAIYRVTS